MTILDKLKRLSKSRVESQVYNEAISEKIFAAEKNIALLRCVIVAFNTLVYVFLMDKEGTNPGLAYTVIFTALLYCFFIIIVKPYRKYPIFLASYFTYSTDAILITLWLLATGGYVSPFFILWYISIVAVAFRFTFRITILTSFLYSLCYLILIAWLGQLEGHVTDMVVRIGYVFLVGILGTIITKETFTQTQEKILMQKLAKDALHAEKTLKVQTNLYESLLKAQSEMGEGISIINGTRFVYVNDALCKIYGYTEEELLAMPSFLDLIVSQEKETLSARFQKRMAGVRDLSDNSETIIVNKAGEKVNIAYTTKKIEMEDGFQLFSIIRDITKRKAEEENLFKLASIVESSEDAIVYISLDYKIVNWNYGAEIIYGYRTDEVIGKSASVIVPPELLKEEKELIDRIISGEHVSHYETIRIQKNGNKIDVSLSLSVVRDSNGTIMGYSTIARDISDRKVTENKLMLKTKELARSNAELEMFAFAASHDLQEPLRKIRLLSDVFEEKYRDIVDEEGKMCIDRMQNASARMQNLINDILTLSRLNNTKEAFVETDINKVIANVINDLEITIKQKEAVTIVESNMPLIKAVPFQLGQLFQNIISNALKYCKKDVVPVITIKSEIVSGVDIMDNEEVLRFKRYCRIYITDNGIGFDEKYSKRIFIPFQRLHGREEFDGTGIGLAICKKVTENHQGFISVKSVLNEGSTFIISLPV